MYVCMYVCTYVLRHIFSQERNECFHSQPQQILKSEGSERTTVKAMLHIRTYCTYVWLLVSHLQRHSLVIAYADDWSGEELLPLLLPYTCSQDKTGQVCTTWGRPRRPVESNGTADQ